jgi:hypothetical protein
MILENPYKSLCSQHALWIEEASQPSSWEEVHVISEKLTHVVIRGELLHLFHANLCLMCRGDKSTRGDISSQRARTHHSQNQVKSI